MALSDRVREAIDGSEKSQADIARACKVTDAAITHLLKDRTLSMKAETALRMEAATGYRANWILYGTGSKKVGDLFWPFSIDPQRFKDLSERDQGEVDGKLQAAIEACEQRADEEAKRVVAQKSRAVTTVSHSVRKSARKH